MTTLLKKYWYKITNKQKYKDYKINAKNKKDLIFFQKNFEDNINSIQDAIKNKDELSFLHSGHIGDMIYALSIVKELSKTHKCKFYVQINKPLTAKYFMHPAGNVYINEKMFKMLVPLLDCQKYLHKAERYNNQDIDINLDIFRKLPVSLHVNSARWYFHITGIQTDLSFPYLDVEPHKTIKDKIVIHRTFRYRNFFINYKFLNNYDNLLFIGMKNEYEDFGTKRISPDRYISHDFMKSEWENMWTKTWLMACSSSDVKKVGDYFNFNIGKESIIVMRSSEDKVSAFYNVCPHRGNKLFYEDFGFVQDIGCSFHGWKFNLDGTNQLVSDSETFRDEVLCYDLDLSSVKVEEECGFVWVTMHEDPMPVRE